MIKAAIMVITSIKGTDMNITAIGVHGMSGTGIPEKILTYSDRDIITGIMPI
ncbi:conserved hypothetical protein [Desulfosarcina cetonica]|nr:conserved hypothetical protein [Desulfosarcina cetonica]